MLLKIVLLATAVSAASYPGGFLTDNKFEVTHGCQQLNANIGYNADHQYYHLDQFKNVRVVNGTTKMRLGVLGDRNAYIRLAPIHRPYSNTRMHEIVISHTIECDSFLQRYVRTAVNKFHGHTTFKIRNTKGWMSWFEPMMITVEVTQNGRVIVTRERDNVVFIDDTDYPVATEYWGFVNWSSDERGIFFVDCPLERPSRFDIQPF